MKSSVKNPVLTFWSHVSNIDFVKVLEIEFIFFYIIFGMVNVLVIERLHSLREVINVMSDLF